MKLPISLLLLAAVGAAVSKRTTERSPTSSQTSKRELLEGNFGQRTAHLNKYEPPKSTPRVQYNDDHQQTQQEQSAAEQIFGTRILPITKISDLLTGQGPPFDVALANHLYAPVSVYNARFQQQPEKTFHNVKIFNQQKLLSQENNQQYDEDHTRKTLTRNPPFHIPGLLGPEFYTQETRYPLNPSKYVAATPDPRHFLYQQQSNIDPYIPIQYYEQRPVSQYPPQDLGFDYENQEAGPENKEQSQLREAEPTSTPKTQDIQDRPSINIQDRSPINIQDRSPINKQGYHAHPNGAVSYSSFLYNQALTDADSDSFLFKSPHKFRSHANEPQAIHQEQFPVPESPFSKPISQDSKLASPESEEQFRPISQQQFSHGPFRSSFQFKSSEDPPKYHTFYLRPVKNPLVKLEPSPQSLENQQLAIQPLPNIEAKLELLNQTFNNSQELEVQVAPLNLSSESKQNKLQDEPNTEGTIQSQQKDTPIPGAITQPQYVTPLYKNPETLESGVTNTPKSQPSNDLTVQPTTIQPETISNSRIDIKENHLSENANLEQVSPTLENLSVSPLMSQSVSTLPPTEYYLSSTPQPETFTREQANSYILPDHKVQIQQQQLHEIHSAFEPRPQPQYLTKKLSEYGRQSLETVSQQVSQSTTPQPSEQPKPDYEIEIESHVDHSQLPKDLQPVTGPHVTNELVENPLIQPLPPGLQSLPLGEQNQSRVEQSQPHALLLQSFGEPPSYHNINYHDPNQLFLDSNLAVHPIQQQFYPQIPPYALQPHGQQSPTFPPVQYFGKYAQSIFGRF